MAKTIPLYGPKADGRVAIVNDADYRTVAPHRWVVMERVREGRLTAGPYAVTHIEILGRRRLVTMHKMITGWPLTDHKNHDTLDNRRKNLRPATEGQNRQNARPRLGSSSRYKGVSWQGRRRGWVATISCDKKTRYLGIFSTEENAARAYDAAARDLFGEFAVLNFPEAGPRVRRQGAAWMQTALEQRRRRESAKTEGDSAA